VYGGPGYDYCLSVFDDEPGDVIDGGEGVNDTYDADPGDMVTGVEVGPTTCWAC
jgi:hypothetical protein